MSRNTVAVSSAILFVVMAAILVLAPVPFVTWRPGSTVDVLGSNGEGLLLEVNGIQNYSTDPSKLLMTTVSQSRVDAQVSLTEALVAHFSSRADVLPRDIVYQKGLSDDEVRQEAVAAMDTSRINATVAALRAAGQTVTEMPQVSAVVLSGPAKDLLLPGDLIESVNGRGVETSKEVTDIIAVVEPDADPVVFTVLRDGASENVSVVPGQDAKGRVDAGIQVSPGFDYTPEVVYRIDSSVVGPSAGLVFSLAIFDKITENNLIGDDVVAGTGTMGPGGNVGSIGGVRQKLAGAESAGAKVFLLPMGNCTDIGDLSTDMLLVPVSTLKDAIAALQLIDEGRYAEVPTCG